MSRIALIGGRGSGKSTVGPLVAEWLGWRFIDADVVLEEKAGKSIAEIFKDDGEAAFRVLEHDNIVWLLEESEIVLATGGGAILRETTRNNLKSECFVIWLDASAETCWQRIQADPLTAARRPNLTASGGFEEVARTLAERRGFYEATAHLRVDANESPETVANTILQAWQAKGR